MLRLTSLLGKCIPKKPRMSTNPSEPVIACREIKFPNRSAGLSLGSQTQTFKLQGKPNKSIL
jgi:hypothetical protein